MLVVSPDLELDCLTNRPVRLIAVLIGGWDALLVLLWLLSLSSLSSSSSSSSSASSSPSVVAWTTLWMARLLLFTWLNWTLGAEFGFFSAERGAWDCCGLDDLPGEGL